MRKRTVAAARLAVGGAVTALAVMTTMTPASAMVRENDRDGISNRWETKHRLNPYADSDRDGNAIWWENRYERDRHPFAFRDSDRDGIPNWWEGWAGRDDLDQKSLASLRVGVVVIDREGGDRVRAHQSAERPSVVGPVAGVAQGVRTAPDRFYQPTAETPVTGRYPSTIA